ncbi:MAG: hypothetical protein KGN76_06010 [Acidobacteriota bacterium]|nr:hypothetical protein [Acidobacteriota bacterium]
MLNVYGTLKDYIDKVFGLALAIGGVLLAHARLIQLYRADPLKAVFSGLLMLLTFLAFFWYYRAVAGELDMLNRAFDEGLLQDGEPRGMTLTIGVALGILFGGLIASSTNILWYTAVIVLLELFDLLGQATVSMNVARMWRRGAFKPDGGADRAEVLFEYYLERPLVVRCAILMFIYFSALILALAGALVGSVYATYAAYVLVIVTIPLGERVIFAWRRARNAALEKHR